jgi:hypothetical protein
MRLIENGAGGDSEDSSSSDVLEMPNPHFRQQGKGDGQDESGKRGKGGKGGKDAGTVHHTEEYWKSSTGKTKADWVKEEEGLNRGHRASESFAVLNELVVVNPATPPLSPVPLLPLS